MNKDQFIELGLTEEQATKAAEASKEELAGFIPKTRFDEVNATKKDLETQITDRDKQLTELSKKAKGNEELEKQITDLQEKNLATASEYESKLKTIKLDSAIKLALKGSKAKYEDLLVGKFDKEKLEISEDGAIKGLDEQLKGIKEGYKDLFEQKLTGNTPNNTGGSAASAGKRQELETIISDPEKSFIQKIAAKNQLFQLKEGDE